MKQGIGKKEAANIYVHTPFCYKKCSYCYFYSLEKPSKRLVTSYIASLQREVLSVDKKRSIPSLAKTVYIGGGTPNYLPNEYLIKVIDILKRNFIINSEVEFTLEINPNYCDIDTLELLREAGVNRLSFGIQTTDSKVLRIIKRNFDKKRVINVVKHSQKLGFKIINLDFMSGLPAYDRKSYAMDLEFVSLVRPQSIYWYEAKNVTDFMKKINPFRYDNSFFDTLTENSLLSLGYKRYMTEFYALKKDYICGYTRDFFLNDYVVGFGPFAISRLKNCLFKNASDLSKYIGMVSRKGSAITDTLPLDKKEEAVSRFSYMIRFGEVDLSQERFGINILKELKEELDYLVSLGYIRILENKSKVLLTHKGLVDTPTLQVALLRKYERYLRGLNLFLGRGSILR